MPKKIQLGISPNQITLGIRRTNGYLPIYTAQSTVWLFGDGLDMLYGDLQQITTMN